LRSNVICIALGVLLGGGALFGSSRVDAAPAGHEDTPERRAAAAAFKRGKQLYASGDYAPALKAFQEGYAAYPLRGFLVNIGQCHRKLGHLKDAETTFLTVLDGQLAPALRAEVEEALAEVRAAEREVTAATPTPPPVVVAPAPAPPVAAPPPAIVAPTPEQHPVLVIATAPPTHETRKMKGWGWALVGIGVGAVAAGVAVGVVFGIKRNEPSASLGVIDTRPR
jgi:hypothetical protein